VQIQIKFLLVLLRVHTHTHTHMGRQMCTYVIFTAWLCDTHKKESRLYISCQTEIRKAGNKKRLRKGWRYGGASKNNHTLMMMCRPLYSQQKRHKKRNVPVKKVAYTQFCCFVALLLFLTFHFEHSAFFDLFGECVARAHYPYTFACWTIQLLAPKAHSIISECTHKHGRVVWVACDRTG